MNFTFFLGNYFYFIFSFPVNRASNSTSVEPWFEAHHWPSCTSMVPGGWKIRRGCKVCQVPCKTNPLKGTLLKWWTGYLSKDQNFETNSIRIILRGVSHTVGNSPLCSFSPTLNLSYPIHFEKSWYYFKQFLKLTCVLKWKAHCFNFYD